MKGHEFSRALRDPEQAKYRRTSVGAYPLFLVMRDGGCLCHACAVEEHVRIRAAAMFGGRSGWEPAGFDVNWEDGSLRCDHCNAWIEAAYADDRGVLA